MSEPLVKYILDRDVLVNGNLIRKHSAIYLPSEVDALLRQREEELAKADQRANVAEANQRQLAGTVKEAHNLLAQLLRREHRAVVRLVKRHKFSKHNNAYEAAWDRPLDMILVALSRRAK